MDAGSGPWAGLWDQAEDLGLVAGLWIRSYEEQGRACGEVGLNGSHLGRVKFHLGAETGKENL